MALKDTIANDLKGAMKARDQVLVDTLRSALSAFSYRRIEAGRELDENEQVDVVRKQVKQRNDSIVEYAKAGRTDLVDRETRERAIIAAYLPRQKTAEEIRAAVRAGLESLAPAERSQGAAMKLLMPKLKGEADGTTIRTVVMEELKALGA